MAAVGTPPSVFKIPEKVKLKTGEENDKNVLQVGVQFIYFCFWVDWFVSRFTVICMCLIQKPILGVREGEACSG